MGAPASVVAKQMGVASMIIGAHVIISSTESEKDRAFLRDVLALSHVDAGHGWLIFGLPPSEVAIHPGDEGGRHELYLMCNDVEAFVTSMSQNGLECSEVEDQGWGLVTQLTLPGGSKLGVYEPRHPRPEAGAVLGKAPLTTKRKKKSTGKTKRSVGGKAAPPKRKATQAARRKVAKKKAPKRRT
jgi:hypothetical protein